MRDLLMLSDYAKGRDNNLNLIRLVAASLVLVSHSYPLATGDLYSEPWLNKVPLSPGALSVDIFFVVSGYLISASMMKSQDVVSYAAARMARIYPALWVALVMTVCAIGFGGGIFTTQGLPDFFFHEQTLRYVLRNGVMFLGGEGRLPGAFERNPFEGSVNGSLWTLRYEIRMYLVIALLWVVTDRLARRGSGPRYFGAAILMCAAALTVFTVKATVLDPTMDHAPFVRLGMMFFAGSALYVLRDRVPVSAAAVVLMCGAMAAAAQYSDVAFGVVYRLTLPYLVLYAAFVPSGFIRQVNRLPDCSYGIYIYAFLIQQLVMAVASGLTPTQLTLVSLPLTVAAALLSWFWVEKPALDKRQVLETVMKGGYQDLRTRLRGNVSLSD